MNITDDANEKIRRGNSQHKIFKFIVLIMVAAFFTLIIRFVLIQFFLSPEVESQSDTLKQKMSYLEKMDNYFEYSYDNMNIDKCNIDNIYIDHITQHKPCIIRKEENIELKQLVSKAKSVLEENNFINEKEEIKLEGLINSLGELSYMNVLNLANLYLNNYNSTNKYNNQADLGMKDYLIISINSDIKYLLSPITQINNFKLIEDNKEGNRIIIHDLIEQYNMFQVVILKAELKAGDAIYIPAYFFKQIILTDSNAKILKYEYNSNSRILKNIFDALLSKDI